MRLVMVEKELLKLIFAWIKQKNIIMREMKYVNVDEKNVDSFIFRLFVPSEQTYYVCS